MDKRIDNVDTKLVIFLALWTKNSLASFFDTNMFDFKWNKNNFTFSKICRLKWASFLDEPTSMKCVKLKQYLKGKAILSQIRYII
jgi:hypothetical protein